MKPHIMLPVEDIPQDPRIDATQGPQNDDELGCTLARHWLSDVMWTSHTNGQGEYRCPSGDPLCKDNFFLSRRALSK